MHRKKMFVLKIVQWKSIASLHRLTQDVQRANLRSTAGDPTWVYHKTDLDFPQQFPNIILHFGSLCIKW